MNIFTGVDSTWVAFSLGSIKITNLFGLKVLYTLQVTAAGSQVSSEMIMVHHHHTFPRYLRFCKPLKEAAKFSYCSFWYSPDHRQVNVVRCSQRRQSIYALHMSSVQKSWVKSRYKYLEIKFLPKERGN